MVDFSRPQGWRFVFGGVNLRDLPDALPPTKYAVAQNIRGASGQAVQVRPGYTQIMSGAASAITDVRAYSTLGTDGLPVFLCRTADKRLRLSSTGNVVDTLAGAAGHGACLVPFRPGASPQSWMYVAGLGDYRKLSAPDVLGAVVAQKVGIAEPWEASPPSPTVKAAPKGPNFVDFSGIAANWVPGGTASGVTNGNLFTDSAVSVFLDPALGSRASVEVQYIGLYLVGMEITIDGGSYVPVQAVLPACPTVSILGGRAVTGFCQVVVDQDLSGSLQRGAIVNVNGEKALVLAVIPGPDGTSVVECSVVGSYSVGTLSGVGAIIMDGAITAGQTLTSPVVGSSVAAGTGTLSQTLGSNPFAGYSRDDYVHVLLLLNNIEAISSVSVVFNTGNTNTGVPDFATGVLTYTATGASLAQALAAGELAEITFPISALLGFSGMPADVNGVRISVTSSGTTSLDVGSLWVGGGGSPDIGDAGIPYRYRVVPRSSLTGAKGNATATMRYGVSPRRQLVSLLLPYAAYDPQIDVWDVYRYGGSVTSYRWIGSGAPGSIWVDNVFDDTALAGAGLEIDNLEPWPSIDAPYQPGSPGVSVAGTFVTLTASNYPATISKWLPGTLLTIGGDTYTLRSRPTGGGPWVFELEESGGAASPSTFVVGEPIVANRALPYLWGPDSTGTIFGCGDPLRPGVLYYSKANNPDSAPDSHVIELCPPSEPLLGGEIINGLSYVASSKRWWALYPSLASGVKPYEEVEVGVGHALAAPYGHISDGQRIFFWGRDGVYAHSGGPAESLTDLDLYPLFPHEGVQATSIMRVGVTFHAPDYSRAATFRLGRAGTYLYVDYQDSTLTPRTLVFDLRSGAWSLDSYALGTDYITVHYGVEQPEGTLTGAPGLYPVLVMGDAYGNLHQQEDLSAGATHGNDNGIPIDCVLATFEWDGGDPRALTQFGDLYLDCLAMANIVATPVSLGVQVSAPVTITASASRQFAVVSLGGGKLARFVGLKLAWTENFIIQTAPTILYLWQGSVVLKPETTTDRQEDWYDLGGAHYIRGFVLRADTFNAAKQLTVQNADTGAAAQTFTINHNGERSIGYAFTTPFVSHLLALKPADSVAWRGFGVQWIMDKCPELTVEATPWTNLGTTGAKYMRGLVIPLDTAGAAVALTVKTSDGASVVLPATTTPSAQKTPVAFAFTVPLIGHDFQIVPSAACRIWLDEAKWDFDPWPELIAEASAWVNFGAPGAKYLRALTVPLDTNSAAVTLDLISSDGGTIALGPFTTPASRKTEVAVAIPPPFVGHEFQIIPQTACRVWWEEAKAHFDPYPEIIPEYTAILEIGGPDAKYVQGLRLTADTGGVAVAFRVLYDGGQVGPLLPATVFSGKQTRPFAFTPFVAHNVQLVPQAAARVWVAESEWVWQPTPELALQWGPTQWTTHGLVGYHHIPWIDVAYAASATVTLTITSQDGTSPAVISLPTTSGAYKRIRVVLTPNKGQAYQYSAVSAAAFQIFAGDWVVWVGAWGRSERYIPWQSLGSPAGAKAEI